MEIKQSRHDALNISIHDRFRMVKCNGSNSRAGVGTNARQILQGRAIGGECSAMLRHDNAGAFQQVARSGIVAKPGPSRHHIGIFRSSQIYNRRP